MLIEQKFTTAVLNRIRVRRERDSALADKNAVERGPIRTRSAMLREARFSDFTAITDLKCRCGIVVDSLENWERLWRRNPALPRMRCSPPMGWVLQADDKIVGYLANISLLYRYGSRTLTAVAGSNFVLEPRYRRFAPSLLWRFFNQKDVDLYLATTAIEAVGNMARIFGSEPLPYSGYDMARFWILRPHSFAQALSKKLGVNRLASKVLEMSVSFALSVDGLIGRRKPKAVSAGLRVCEIQIEEIGAQFDTLWQDKVNQGARVYADRSAQILRWHCDIPRFQGKTHILGCHKQGELVGYAILRDNSIREDGLQTSILADLLVKGNDLDVAGTLLVAAYENAKKAGSNLFELRGLPCEFQELCSEWKPFVRKYSACPFYFKASDPVFHKAFAARGTWYTSLFDGDATLMP